jgi:hypothetical protein
MKPYSIYIPEKDFQKFEDSHKYNIVNIYSSTGHKVMIGFDSTKMLADAYFEIYKDSNDLLIYDPANITQCQKTMVGNYFYIVDRNEFLLCKLTITNIDNRIIQIFKKD